MLLLAPSGGRALLILINYKESVEDARARFSDWLEDAIVRGLKLWQESAL